MKTPSLRLALAVAACLAAAQSARAQTWVPTAASTTYDWNVDGNWSPAAFPNAIGATVTWSDIAGAQTVRLQQPITVGSLTFGDASGTNGAVTISTNTLTLDNTAGNAAIISQGSANTISSSIELTDTVDVTTTSDLTISTGVISGAGAINKAGNGTLSLNGANIFSGGVNLSGSTAAGGSRLNVNSASALGTGTLTISGGNLAVANGASNVTVTTGQSHLNYRESI